MEFRLLGCIEHSVADTMMRELQQQRVDDESGDIILILEHPEVVTIGPRARKEGVTIPSDYASNDVDRGGGITWHGPGQIVVYPIIRWRQDDEKNVAQIISKIEEWIITALGHSGIVAGRDKRMQGVWVEGHKVASIGLSFLRWVSRHGFTINHDTPPGRVEGISGCGLGAEVTTSLSQLGHMVSKEKLIESLISTSEACLNRNIS